jgi:hypothetical protein
VQNGHIKRLTDEDIQSSVLEVLGANVRGARPVAAAGWAHPVAPPQVSTTFISCPADANETLGIKMPYLVMIIKNMRKYFSFEVTARQSAPSSQRTPALTRSGWPSRPAGHGRQGHQAPLQGVHLPGTAPGFPAAPSGKVGAAPPGRPPLTRPVSPVPGPCACFPALSPPPG